IPTARNDHDHVFLRPDRHDLPSAAIPAELLHALRLREPPAVSIPPAIPASGIRLFRRRLMNPFARHDLLPVPLAVVQIQITDLPEVARIEMAVAPAMRPALFIR